MNGTASQNGQAGSTTNVQDELLQLNLEMKNLKYNDKYAKYHGDKLIGVCSPTSDHSWSRLIVPQDKVAPKGFVANLENSLDDFRRIFRPENFPAIGKVVIKAIGGHGLDVRYARAPDANTSTNLQSR